jgi:hypothetical protein
MRFYKKNSLIKNGADTREVDLSFDGKITCGTFVNRERPTFLDQYNSKMAERYGSSYQLYEGVP